MWSKIALVFGVICCIGLISAQQQQQPAQTVTPCRQTFINSLYACITNNSMTTNDFFGLLNNKSRAGTEQGTDTFKDTACGKQKELIKCGFEFMQKLDESKICQPGANNKQKDEWPPTRTQFFSIIAQLDFICAHPCRTTLLPSFRECYATAQLDPELFLSNATMGRGAVIGTNSKDAKQYCLHKDALIKCMKDHRNKCPDAPALLRNIGLDLESMEKGVGILCKHPDVYLSGIDCFEIPTKGVEDCQEDQNNRMVNLLITAQNTSMDEELFMDKFCKIRVGHVGCDLNEWAKKKHERCTPAVIGLRTEMECGLMPIECVKSQKSTLDVTCHVDAFNRDERINSATTTSISLSLTAVFLLVSQCVQSYLL